MRNRLSNGLHKQAVEKTGSRILSNRDHGETTVCYGSKLQLVWRVPAAEPLGKHTFESLRHADNHLIPWWNSEMWNPQRAYPDGIPKDVVSLVLDRNNVLMPSTT